LFGFGRRDPLVESCLELSQRRNALGLFITRGIFPSRLGFFGASGLANNASPRRTRDSFQANDRVLLVGDRRQHEAVEAGRPFAQLQDAGMKTVKLAEIVRQKDPELKQVVEQLARGEVREAIQNLDWQGRVHEIQSHNERIAAIAKEYAKSPENTLVISPDNRSRAEINERVHAEFQRGGLVGNEDHHIRTLVPGQDLTGAERTWAERYEVGDMQRYSRSSKEAGRGKGQYAQVKSIDAPKNRLTVELQDGIQRTYDPRRQQGVSVFREEMRKFSVGDRIQFTTPANELKIANRELGTIERIGEDGRLCLKMDGGRALALDTHKRPHLDYGYAITSDSSQGQTADRVLNSRGH
jgi:ATP-dependent exoDNAse (exonuclease V) alpha subunit